MILSEENKSQVNPRLATTAVKRKLDVAPILRLIMKSRSKPSKALRFELMKTYDRVKTDGPNSHISRHLTVGGGLCSSLS